MELLGIVRMLGSLAIILGMLAGGLWAVRRFDIRLPGRAGGGQERRLQVVERIGIDQRRALLIIRRDNREHLIVVGPEGSVTIESFNSPRGPKARGVRTASPATEKFAALVKDKLTECAAPKRSKRATPSRRAS